jgi:hypothetical protein
VAIAVALDRDDVGVVDGAIEQGRSAGGVGKDGRPVVGREDCWPRSHRRQTKNTWPPAARRQTTKRSESTALAATATAKRRRWTTCGPATGDCARRRPGR